jgi:peptidoglycan/LPS O-acetylase OafA/YrhL
LLALLVVNTILVLALQQETISHIVWSDIVVLFYAANWVKTFSRDVVPGLGHTWSLAVEEQFYLVWPWLVILAVRRRVNRLTLVWILVAGIAASAITRALLWVHVHQAGYGHVYFRTDARADTLLVGALLAVARRERLLPAFSQVIPYTAVGFIAFVALTVSPGDDWMMFGGYTAVAAAAALLIAAALSVSAMRTPLIASTLQLKPLVHVGRISYGLYLWHVPMFDLIARIAMPGPARPFVGLALAVAVAEVSMLCVERPFLKMKTRIERSETGVDASSALASEPAT